MSNQKLLILSQMEKWQSCKSKNFILFTAFNAVGVVNFTLEYWKPTTGMCLYKMPTNTWTQLKDDTVVYHLKIPVGSSRL